MFLSIPILNDLIQGNFAFITPLILACAALYILAIALDITGSMNLEGGILNMLSPTNESLYNLGMGGRIPWNQGRWWTMITANYLHGGILHIAFNMLWLSRIGPWAVELYGTSRFWIIYTIAGLTGGPSNHRFAPLRPGDVRSSTAVITRIAEALDWSPACSLEQGLSDTVKWYRHVAR